MSEECQNGNILFGRYKILSHIGHGGMGSVYKVLDEKSEEILALKVLTPKTTGMEKAVSRFKNEFSVLKSLEHENIVRAYEFHEEDGKSFSFSMEYVEGEDLDSLIYGESSFISVEDSINILEQIAEGLSYAHKRDTIHRDLKPANILLSKNSSDSSKYQVKIVDFGLAQGETEGNDMSKSSNQVGTAYYMSPEQHRGETITLHTDIYSFGILAFELLTRKKPFSGETPFSLFLAHVSKDTPSPKALNPEIPSWLSTMVEICIDKEKEGRYQTMNDILNLIKAHKNSKEKKGFFSRLML